VAIALHNNLIWKESRKKVLSLNPGKEVKITQYNYQKPKTEVNIHNASKMEGKIMEREMNDLQRDQKNNNERRNSMKKSLIKLAIVCSLAGMLLGGLSTPASADPYYQYVAQDLFDPPAWESKEAIRRLYWHPASSGGLGVNLSIDGTIYNLKRDVWRWFSLKYAGNGYYTGERSTTEAGCRIFVEKVKVRKFDGNIYPYPDLTFSQFVFFPTDFIWVEYWIGSRLCLAPRNGADPWYSYDAEVAVLKFHDMGWK